MIAALYNIPRTPTELNQFSFHNANAHEIAGRIIRQNLGIEIPQYVLDPIPLEDFGGWLYNHQSSHNAVNTLLKIQGQDLSDLDPNDLAQFADWIQIHANEHVLWGQALRYG